jgi:PAS domain S-box-containing protein
VTETPPLDNGAGERSREATARRQGEERAGHSEARYQGIFDASPDLIYVTDLRGIVVEANRALCERLGLSPTEVCGRHYMDFFAGQDRTELAQAVQTLRAGHMVRGLHVRAGLPGGKTWDYEVNAIPLRDADGTVTGTLSVARDVTDRRQAEQQVQESEARYRSLIDNARDVIFTLALDGTFSSFNPAFHTLTGWSPHEWIGRSFLALPHEDDASRALEVFQRAVRGETPALFELRVRTKAGAYVTGEFLVTPQQRDGKVYEILGVARDISERKREHEELQRQRAFAQRVADTVPNVVYLYDVEQGAITWINAHVHTAFGYSPEEILRLGASVAQTVIHPEDVEWVTDYRTRFAGGDPTDTRVVEFRVKTASGDYRWIRSREQIFAVTEDGAPTQVIGAVEDITPQRRIAALRGERQVNLEELPANLRNFRLHLNMSQQEFGARFGGYTQRQITGYESGRAEIPLKLILALRAQGFAPEDVLGRGAPDVAETAANFLTATGQAQSLVRRLARALLQIVEDEWRTMEMLLHELDMPPSHKDEQRLARRLQQLLADTEKDHP